MKPLSTSMRLLQAGCALALLAALPLSHAQTRIRPATQPTGPTAAQRVVTPAPSLAPPSPSQPTLTSRFPAGLPSITTTTAPGMPFDATAAAEAFSGVAVGGYSGAVTGYPGTNTMGSYGGPAGSQTMGPGSGAYTALQIAQSFLGADANRDGELTRAEAQRLMIAPYSFEEMDENKDGILSRFEYQNALR